MNKVVKVLPMYRELVLVFMLLLLSDFAFSQIYLKNPGFFDSETILYSQNIEGEFSIIEYKMYYKEENGNSWLEYHTFSDEQEVIVKFDSNNLTAFYSEIWERQDDSTTHSINEIVMNQKIIEDDELLITDMYGIIMSLRGFPWKEKKSAKIVFLNRPENFRLEMKVKGKDTIHIKNRSYDCWKVQIGMGGVMGAIFPKSYYWYSVESPHYLVRGEASGMPGSPKTILEIQSYSSK